MITFARPQNLEQVLPEQPCDAFNLFFQEGVTPMVVPGTRDAGVSCGWSEDDQRLRLGLEAPSHRRRPRTFPQAISVGRRSRPTGLAAANRL